MKRILPLILAIMISVPVSASTKDHISDYAGLLTSDEVDELNSTIMEMEYYTNCKYYIVTTYDDDGLGAKEFAEEFLYDNVPDSGAVFLIDYDSREYYISTLGEVAEKYTEDRIDETVSKVWTYVAEKDYLGFFKAVLEDTKVAMGLEAETETE